MSTKGQSMDWVVVGAAVALVFAWLTEPRREPTTAAPRRREVRVGYYNDEYTDDEHNKQLEIYRALSDAEKAWADRCSGRVANLLYSLQPEDATRDLFTFFERRAFDIPVTHRPRPKE